MHSSSLMQLQNTIQNLKNENNKLSTKNDNLLRNIKSSNNDFNIQRNDLTSQKDQLQKNLHSLKESFDYTMKERNTFEKKMFTQEEEIKELKIKLDFKQKTNTETVLDTNIMSVELSPTGTHAKSTEDIIVIDIETNTEIQKQATKDHNNQHKTFNNILQPVCLMNELGQCCFQNVALQVILRIPYFIDWCHKRYKINEVARVMIDTFNILNDAQKEKRIC